jgi:hypothetical protein
MRGRMMSFVAMGYFGMLPLGSLLIGFVSQHAGATTVLLCQGIAAILISFVFGTFLRKRKLSEKDKKEFSEAEQEVLKKT